MPVLMAAQTSGSSCPRKDGVTVSISKDGIKTVKDVLGVSVCPDEVYFVVSKTSYQTFYRLNGGQWVDGATDKLVKTVEKEGILYFIKSEKKFFGYDKNSQKDEEQ